MDNKCEVCFISLNKKVKYCSKKCNSIAYNKKYYHKNKEREQKRSREWIAENKTRRSIKQKVCYKRWMDKGDNRNNEQIRLRKYREENKEIDRKSKKKWRDANKGKIRAKCAKRRAQKLNATVEGYDAEIKEIYKNCPKGYHVDHIVPLQGKTVCGLHVPCNLQYLTAEENLRKSNKLIV